jgi:uncharacterized metal-binding protein
MESNQKDCKCGNAEYIVLACSGACDLGQVTDLVARKLRNNNIRKMNCLAAVGAGIDTTIEKFKVANLLMIDGCAIDCGKKILENAGINQYKYLRLTDHGYVKGQTPVTNDLVEKVYEKAVLDF